MEPKTSFYFPLLQRRMFTKTWVPEKRMKKLTNTTSEVFRATSNSDLKMRKELSPRMCMGLNPGYRFEYIIGKSESQQRFKDHSKKKNRQEFIMIDKVYHRQRDDQSKFAEQFFMNRILSFKR